MSKHLKGRPTAILVEYIENVARRYRCKLTRSRVVTALSKLYKSSKPNPHFVTFACTAAIVLYNQSPVKSFPRTYARTKEGANKKFALCFCTDYLSKHGYELRVCLTEAILEELIEGEFSAKRLKVWMKKCYQRIRRPRA